MAWLKARGLDSAAPRGRAHRRRKRLGNRRRGALGQLIEGVLVDDPAALVDALGELGDGRIALVADEAGEGDFAPTSLAAKVRGPLAIRRLLARLHGADDLATARTLRRQLGEQDSVITRSGERLGEGWVRVSRSGAAKQARCCANARSRNCARRSIR